jgi:citrate lyase subunit beta/citryl-CoA lyase
MKPNDLRLCRTILFLPASNGRAIEKARALGADMVILDLEDAVKEEDKAAARAMAIDATREGFGDRLSAIRMNAAGTRFYADDVEAVRASSADFVILAKVETPGQAAEAASATAKPILAMIETPRGVLDAAAIAPATSGLIAGTNDLSAELGIQPGGGRPGLVHALQHVVLAARAAGVAAFDGVFNGLDDQAGLEAECRQGRAYGFDGKSLIHPNQIETANRLFGPSDEELAAAERLIAAATGGAERFEGKMIEAMHVDQARAILAKARRG